jgi:hypothetical protein
MVVYHISCLNPHNVNCAQARPRGDLGADFKADLTPGLGSVAFGYLAKRGKTLRSEERRVASKPSCPAKAEHPSNSRVFVKIDT